MFGLNWAQRQQRIEHNGGLEAPLVASWRVCTAELVVLGELWRSNNGCSRMGKKKKKTRAKYKYIYTTYLPTYLPLLLQTIKPKLASHGSHPESEKWVGPSFVLSLSLIFSDTQKKRRSLLSMLWNSSRTIQLADM